MNRIPGELRDPSQVTRARRDRAGAQGTADGLVGDVDVLVRPEGLRIEAVPGGNGIVTDRTFLGSVTRVSVRLSGDVTVKVDQPSTEAAGMLPGTSVRSACPARPSWSPSAR